MHIAVPTDSNLLDMPSISQPASKLSRGTLAVEKEKEGELATTSLEFEFHFQLYSPMALRQLSSLSDFRQTAQSGNNCKCIQTLKASAKGIVITSLLMSSLLISISHRLFRSRYSNSRDVVGSCSFLYPPHRQSALESLLARYQYL